MFYYLVTLKGEWERHDTASYEITDMRSKFYPRSMGNTENWRVNHLSPIVSGKVTASHHNPNDPPFFRRGHFQVLVRVDVSGWQWLRAPQIRSRARTLLEWKLQDMTCRPPKLTNVVLVDWSRGREEVAA